MIEFLSMFFYLQPMMVVWYMPWVAFLIWIIGRASNARASLLHIFASGAASVITLLVLGILFFSFFGIQQISCPSMIYTLLLLVSQVGLYTLLFNTWMKVFDKRVSKSFDFFSFIANGCIGIALWCMYIGIWNQ